MAWPPPVLPINLTNATAQQDIHPAAHNNANQAINDITAHVQGQDTALSNLTAETRRTKAWYAQAMGASGPYGVAALYIPGLSVTVTFEGGKLYLITAHVPNVRAIDYTQANLSIATGGNVLLQTCNMTVEADSDFTMETSVLYPGDGTTQSIYAQMESTATSMPAIYIDGNPTHKHFLLVEEVNPS